MSLVHKFRSLNDNFLVHFPSEYQGEVTSSKKNVTFASKNGHAFLFKLDLMPLLVEIPLRLYGVRIIYGLGTETGLNPTFRKNLRLEYTHVYCIPQVL